MQKICTSCGLERDAEKDFPWEYKAKGKRKSRCKYCQSLLSKEHYKNNKQTYYKRSSTRKTQTLALHSSYIASYLSTHPCVDCGETDIRVLESDHIDTQKLYDVSDLLCGGYKWSTIEAEIAKCEVRCANCHRIKTIEHSRGGRSTQPLKTPRKKTWQLLYTYLSTHPCVNCGKTDIRILEFDHVRGQKIDDISHLLSQGYGWSQVEAEIDKCEVRCTNCHRIKTGERGNFWKHDFIPDKETL